jgi:hypothetical protein
MMNGFLITPSLYSAWQYWKNSEGSGKEEILDALNKVGKEKSPAMRAGIEFENAIRHVCAEGSETQEATPLDPSKPIHVQGVFAWEHFCVLEAAKIVKGGLWQQRVSRMLDGDLLYGIADVVRRDTIFDIKLVNKYEIGKYESSIQHLLYMHAADMPNFQYVISDGCEVYVEAYHWEAKSLETLRERIAEMKGCFLLDGEMSLAFRTHWRHRKSDAGEARESAAAPRQSESDAGIQRTFEDVTNRNINALKRDMSWQ